MTRSILLYLVVLGQAVSYGSAVYKEAHPEPWAKYGPLPDLAFSGITGFARLPHRKCLDEPGKGFDIGILGMPFDTSVSYRPGARFGPQAIRAGSRRQAPYRSFLMPWGFSPLQSGLDIVDCNDIPISPYDPTLAIDQIQTAYSTLLNRPTKSQTNYTSKLSKDGREHPRILSLGGDHTIVLPILGALKEIYGPISVLHFDAHLDTWSGLDLAGASTKVAEVCHGTFFWKAAQLGYISNTSSIHAGIRTRISGIDARDLLHDEAVGFQILTTDDIDDLGSEGIAQAIKRRVGNGPCYLSFDIDTIDPSMAPGTGTPESGGWTTREIKRIIRSLDGLNIVGADIVEVSPAYDHAEITAMAAADLALEILALMISHPDGERRAAMSRGKMDEELREKTKRNARVPAVEDEGSLQEVNRVNDEL